MDILFFEHILDFGEGISFGDFFGDERLDLILIHDENYTSGFTVF